MRTITLIAILVIILIAVPAQAQEGDSLLTVRGLSYNTLMTHTRDTLNLEMKVSWSTCEIKVKAASSSDTFYVETKRGARDPWGRPLLMNGQTGVKDTIMVSGTEPKSWILWTTVLDYIRIRTPDIAAGDTLYIAGGTP